MTIAGRRPTLTDCGCEATVYADGSGIEMHYCPMHQAAPQLLEALREAKRDILDPNRGISASGPALAKIEAAIKAAGEAGVTDTEKLAICERALAIEVRAHAITQKHSTQLLEALQSLLRHVEEIERPGTEHPQARAAIAAAGG